MTVVLGRFTMDLPDPVGKVTKMSQLFKTYSAAVCIDSILRALTAVLKVLFRAVSHHGRRTCNQLSYLYMQLSNTPLPEALHVITELSTFIGCRC